MPSLPFETSFTESDWSAWDSGNFLPQAVYSTKPGPYPTLGIGNGHSATCMLNPDNPSQGAQFNQCIVGNCHKGGSGVNFGADAGISTTSTRFQYSIACDDLNQIPEVSDPNIGNDGISIGQWYTLGFYNNTIEGLPNVNLFIRRNGAFRLYLLGEGNPAVGSGFTKPWPPAIPGKTHGVYVDSPPNTIAFDGINHAFVLTLIFTGHSSLHYIFTMDGVTIFDNTITAGTYYCSGQWGQPITGIYRNIFPWDGTGTDPNLPPNNMSFPCPSEYVPQSGINHIFLQVWRKPACGIAHLMSRLAHVSIVNTPSSYPKDNTVPVLLLNACAARITDMVVDASGKITLTGVNFPSSMVITLKGPGDVNTTYSVVSQTATQMVINNLNPPFVSGGTYCVTGPCI